MINDLQIKYGSCYHKIINIIRQPLNNKIKYEYSNHKIVDIRRIL